MNGLKRVVVSVLFAGIALAGVAVHAEAVVYKSALCGCCGKYIDYLRANGMDVKAVDVANTDAVKDRLGVPERLRSCHTMVVDGYLVEGHVPIATIKRLLQERPGIAGVALPGMPPSSPGMGPQRPGSLQIFEITTRGEAGALFAVE
ncbi:MAG: hypothetical protein K8E66_04695 [Phycisphaerales bacterium]|nr:hypothetical protein [Phycisphaerales bacterium]